MNVRITLESPFILMLSQGGSRGCAALSAREVLGAQRFRIFAPREGWFQCLKVLTAHHSRSTV